LCPADPGPIGRRSFLHVTPAPEDQGPSLLGQHGQLLGGAGFANSRLAGKHDQPSPARQGMIQGCGKLGHLPLAANKHMANVPSGLGFYHATTTGS